MTTQTSQTRRSENHLVKNVVLDETTFSGGGSQGPRGLSDAKGGVAAI